MINTFFNTNIDTSTIYLGCTLYINTIQMIDVILPNFIPRNTKRQEMRRRKQICRSQNKTKTQTILID